MRVAKTFYFNSSSFTSPDQPNTAVLRCHLHAGDVSTAPFFPPKDFVRSSPCFESSHFVLSETAVRALAAKRERLVLHFAIRLFRFPLLVAGARFSTKIVNPGSLLRTARTDRRCSGWTPTLFVWLGGWRRLDFSLSISCLRLLELHLLHLPHTHHLVLDLDLHRHTLRTVLSNIPQVPAMHFSEHILTAKQAPVATCV